MLHVVNYVKSTIWPGINTLIGFFIILFGKLEMVLL